jgi:hypothetical protein
MKIRLYILEGVITIVWAACCIWLVPKNFETAYFLNEEERTVMRRRAARTQAYSDSAGSGHYGKSDIREAAKDIKSWLHGCIQIAVVTILYGFGTFLPIIIRNGFRYSVKEVRMPYMHFRLDTDVLTGTIPCDTSQHMGRDSLRHRRLFERPIPVALYAFDPDGTDWHHWLCHSALACQFQSAIFCNLPHFYRLLHLHWWKHHLVIC